MSDASTTVCNETSDHFIEVSDGCLTIDTKKFPDACISLSEEETEEVYKLLQKWREP